MNRAQKSDELNNLERATDYADFNARCEMRPDNYVDTITNPDYEIRWRKSVNMTFTSLFNWQGLPIRTWNKDGTYDPYSQLDRDCWPISWWFEAPPTCTYTWQPAQGNGQAGFSGVIDYTSGGLTRGILLPSNYGYFVSGINNTSPFRPVWFRMRRQYFGGMGEDPRRWGGFTRTVGPHGQPIPGGGWPGPVPGAEGLHDWLPIMDVYFAKDGHDPLNYYFWMLNTHNWNLWLRLIFKYVRVPPTAFWMFFGYDPTQGMPYTQTQEVPGFTFDDMATFLGEREEYGPHFYEQTMLEDPITATDLRGHRKKTSKQNKAGRHYDTKKKLMCQVLYHTKILCKAFKRTTKVLRRLITNCIF